MAETPNITPEFSRIVATTELAGEEAVHRIEAGAAECAALATRFDLLALKNLAATVRLKRVRGGALVRLSADFSADVVQSCVVSLEPVSTHIEESFTVLYGPESAVAEAQEVVLEVGDEEPPEPMTDGNIDLGEAVAQQLALALDPYPRAPGARVPVEDLEGVEISSDEEAPRGEKPGIDPSSPFAALASLKEKWKN